MRLHVDWTRCDGHGACAELLPELDRLTAELTAHLAYEEESLVAALNRTPAPY